MTKTIGSTAGSIWSYLSKNETASITKLANDTGLGKNEIQRALGWLAREDKIEIVQKGRTETISLK